MTEYPGVSSLPRLGRVAVFDGVEYRASQTIGSRRVTLYMDRHDWDGFASTDEVGQSDANGAMLWVDVPRDRVERLFTRRAMARWFDIEVHVSGPLDTESVLVWYGGDPMRAQARGMKGSQYDGWRAVVPFAEFSSVRIVEE